MSRHGLRRQTLTGMLALVVGLIACDDAPQTPLEPDLGVVSRGGGARSLEVYTQNLFHGGDTGPILTLDFNDVPAVIQEANVFWGDVQASDFPSRAEEIVDELEERMPHVVAFQEVFDLVVRDAVFQPVGGLDMLAVVEAEIAERGLPYVTDVVQNNTAVTLPLGFDPALPGISAWLDVTDRVVSLRRSDVDLIETGQGEYAAQFPLGPATLKRGWARLSVRHAGATYHFVNTHLEVQHHCRRSELGCRGGTGGPQLDVHLRRTHGRGLHRRLGRLTTPPSKRDGLYVLPGQEPDRSRDTRREDRLRAGTFIRTGKRPMGHEARPVPIGTRR